MGGRDLEGISDLFEATGILKTGLAHIPNVELDPTSPQKFHEADERCDCHLQMIKTSLATMEKRLKFWHI